MALTLRGNGQILSDNYVIDSDGDTTFTDVTIGDGTGSTYVEINNAASGDISSGYNIKSGNVTTTSLYGNADEGWTTLLSGGSMGFRVNNSVAGFNPMNIDTSGRVTTPYQPGFKAGLNTNTNVSTFNNIIFDTTSGNGRYNTGGHYSTSTGRFTAPVSGAYHFDVGLLYGPSVPNGTNFDDAAFLYLNGVITAYDERRAEYVDGTTGNSGYYGTWIHTQVYMNTSDYVSVVNYNRFAGVHGNKEFTWFAGYLIG